MKVYVPENRPNLIIGRNGCEYRAQHLDGKNVVDIPAAEYVLLTMGRHGKSWADANPEAAKELANFRIAL